MSIRKEKIDQTPLLCRTIGPSLLTPGSEGSNSTPFFTPPQFSSCVVSDNSVGVLSPLQFTDDTEMQSQQSENPFVQEDLKQHSSRYSQRTGRGVISQVESSEDVGMYQHECGDATEEENIDEGNKGKRVLPEDMEKLPPQKRAVREETVGGQSLVQLADSRQQQLSIVVFPGLLDHCSVIDHGPPVPRPVYEVERSTRVGKAFLDTAAAVLAGRWSTPLKQFEPGCLEVRGGSVDSSTSFSGVVLVETHQQMRPLLSRRRAPLTTIANYLHGHDCSALLSLLDHHMLEHANRLKDVQKQQYQARVQDSIQASVIPSTSLSFEELKLLPRSNPLDSSNHNEVLTKDIFPTHPELQYWNTVPIHLSRVDQTDICRKYKWTLTSANHQHLAYVAVEALIIESQRCLTNLHVGAHTKRALLDQLEEADWTMEMAALKHLNPGRKLKHLSILNTLLSQTSTGIDEKNMRRIQEARKQATAEFQIN